MFPLESALLPGEMLPLRIFEPRYAQLVADCLATPDQAFGVVMIERGREVGGGDVRCDVGALARITEYADFGSGQYTLRARIAERIRVLEWLPDDPYPRAAVEVMDEAAAAPAMVAARRAVEVQLRRVLTLAADLGAAVAPSDVRLDDDPVRAAFEACALAPIGSLDAQRLLEIDDPADRLARLEAILVDTAELLELRLGES